MKKENLVLLIALLFVLSLLVYSEKEAATGLAIYYSNVYSCAELSKTRNFGQQGFISVKQNADSAVEILTDVCSDGNIALTSCKGTNCGAFEYTCGSSYYRKEFMNCIECNYGACKTISISPSNKCTSGCG